MQILQGIPVSSGIVIGRVFVLDHDPHRVARWTVSPDRAEDEIARFDAAVEQSLADLDGVYTEAEAELGIETAKIFLFHKGKLSDSSLIEPIREMIRQERVNAEYAVVVAFDALAKAFRRQRNSAFRTKTDDIRDLATRVLDHLMGSGPARLAELEHPTIIVATDLTPSQTAGFDRKTIVGFLTDLGGRTSHTAIVANALGLPAVVGCRNATITAHPGQTAIIDGDRGMVILDPEPQELERYRGFIEQRRTYQLSLDEVAGLPSITRDGTHIRIVGNVEFPEECSTILDKGAEGVGLYRSEFLYFAGGEGEPTEEDHFAAYTECINRLGGKSLTIRTVDLGADKYTQEQAKKPERNPALGLRSIRYSLADKAAFRTQLRAILRASTLGPVKIMFPMVTTIGELRHAKLVLRDVMEDLDDEGIEFDREIEVGVMIEVPSAALIAATLAKEADFFSIGTNDLVQYTLAVDRTNERVSGLYQPAHPAVVQLIRGVIKAAKKAEIEVSCCGEAAGELDYALLLMGLGLRTLSVPGNAIPHLKRLVRSVSIQQCERVARKVRSFDSEVLAATYLRDRTRKMVPEAFDGRAVEARD